MNQRSASELKKKHLQRLPDTSSRSWKQPHEKFMEQAKNNCVIHCGWGRVLFSQTFQTNDQIIKTLQQERPGERDLAFYVVDPQVLLAKAPGNIFLDPSHTYRIWIENYRTKHRPFSQVIIRRARSKKDLEQINDILLARNMIPLNPKVFAENKKSRTVIYLVAVNSQTNEVVGFVNGVDHTQAFNDPDRGSSLWALSVSPHCELPGVGEALTRYLIEYFHARDCRFMDLSVVHENKQAIKLYEKLGFERVPVFCVKNKNEFNAPLYTGPKKQSLNPYADIIIREAQRRGINVTVQDKQKAYFKLSWGGRSINCRESLTDMTSAVAMSRCMDKSVTLSWLKKNKIRVPQQVLYKEKAQAEEFLEKHKKIVVKPSEGEQGFGVKVGITTKKGLNAAIKSLQESTGSIVLEEFVAGQDVRIIVIDYKMVAAAVRRPPKVTGDGRSTVKSLIQKLSRRRSAATQGESKIPMDAETERCLKQQKVNLRTILKPGRTVRVRNTANLHTGGTIHDITNQISDEIRQVAEKAALSLEMPVVGLDFIMPELTGSTYRIIEANERPGLENHQPQPTAERFIDFLFPLTIPMKTTEASDDTTSN